MNDPKITTPQRKPAKRRLLRLSLRALMLLVVFLALGLGWVVHRVQVQRDAIRAIQKTGGKITYDWQRMNGPAPLTPRQPKGPKWLVDRLGVDYFQHVVMVQLGPTATDAEMEHVGRLPRLVSISAIGAKEITDAGAAQLAGLNNLESVALRGTQVTGGALLYFRDKTKLKHLMLNSLPITDADLANIEKLANLDIIDLSGTKVTDAGLAHLDALVNLIELRLDSTAVTGTGFAHLKDMRRLLWLRLGHSQVRDLSTIPPLPALMGIVLTDTSVDDTILAGLQPDFPKLKVIYLVNTAVTDAGLPQLLKFHKSMTGIGLSGPKITDAAAPTIAKLDQLITVQLSDTKMTDATLDQLTGLKALRTLDLDRNDTTDAGLARLKKALPQVRSTKEAQAATLASMKARAAANTPPKNPASQP